MADSTHRVIATEACLNTLGISQRWLRRTRCGTYSDRAIPDYRYDPQSQLTVLLRGRDIKGSEPHYEKAHEEKQDRSEEHTSELQSQSNLVCRLLLEKKKTKQQVPTITRQN